MNIAFLLPVVSQVRYHRRISALRNLGVKAQILAFERDHYRGKPWPDGYTSLGTVEHGNYIRRIAPLIKVLPLVRAVVQGVDAIYAFGLDTLFLGWLASRFSSKQIKIIYEVGDIRSVFLEGNLLSRCMRSLERFLLREVGLLVVTSEAFVTGYFHGVQGLGPLHYQVIENKLAADVPCGLQDVTLCNRQIDGLRIGYFGLIRCRRSWSILNKAVAAGNGRIQLYLRGISMGVQDLEDQAQRNPQIDYDGPYMVPDDLPSMYGRVDMVWACYPYQGSGLGNWRWARTNRFYEACYFRRPMFAQKGTEDSRPVESLGLGLALDLADIEGTVDKILEIRRPDIDRWRQNMKSLPKEAYVLSNEHEQLLEAIQ